MKQKYLFIFLTVLSAVFACEQLDESALGEKETVEKVPMTFTAVIEKDAQTKTVLGDEVTTDNVTVKKLLWQPGDVIGVSPISDNDAVDVFSKFTSTLSEASTVSEFDGSAAFASRYWAFYPYNESLNNYMSDMVIFEMPAIQKYVEGSFDSNAAPMVAIADRGENFEFKNLCGIVAFQLTGESAIKNITFKGTDESGSSVPLAGTFCVNPADNEPVMTLFDFFESYENNVKYSLTLDCVEPVQLNNATPTTFYMMLPPATYANFTLIITTADGEIMLKSGSNLTITRSHLKPTGELGYVETKPIDLSEHGNANCYIVPSAGLYSFDAGVIGNGSEGIIDGTDFHTVDPNIVPSKVEILWQDREDVIDPNSLTYDQDDREIRFIATGREGNVLVAAKDGDNILWSWHIWATDAPQEQNYTYGNYVMLDRNLGAIRADRGTGEEWKDAGGLMYQWGRKDPFTFKYIQDQWNSYPAPMYETKEEMVSYATAIANPTVFYGAGYFMWNETVNNSLWSSTQKTIYDPCPAGYMVPSYNVWRGFIKDYSTYASSADKLNISGTHNKGHQFVYDGTNVTYYPTNSKINHNGDIEAYSENHAYLWSADVVLDEWSDRKDKSSYSFNSYYYTYVDSWLTLQETPYKSNALSVRCMKDKDYEATRSPQVEFIGTTDVTTTSVTMNAKVIDEGWDSVTDRGFVWGTTSDLSDGKKVSCGAGTGEFSYTLSGLATGSVYYVKAYAVNGYTTSYDEIHRFSTCYSDDAENLSSSGTANCYMVRPVAGTYSFDARVKGNSTESLSPVSAELIWEVDGNRNVSDNIVDNARLSDGWILFELPSDVQPGNALIAAKDADGKIVWSWHIWVADFDPVATQHLYNNGAVFMDRNLGAVVNAPDFNDLEGTWASAYGTIYQWGRKDPLVKGLLTSDRYSAFNSIEEANANPTTFAANIPWLSPSVPDLWRPEKTMYDPCPVGWKVPSYEEINGMWYYGEFSSYGLKMSVNNSQISWFGFGDYIHSDGYYYSNMGEVCYWTTNYQPSWNNVRTLYLYNGQGSWDKTPTDAYPIRCMKDE